MPELLGTTTVKRHSHIAYLKDDGTGITTESKGHSHVLSFHQRREMVVDPLTGQVLEAAREEFWEMTPGQDGHIHELVPIEVKATEKKEEDEEVVRDVRNLFRSEISYEEESHKKAKESEEFYSGKQWTDTQRQILESRKRAVLTINETESLIDLLSGYQRQNRSDFHFFPTEEGDQRVSDILKYVVKNITEMNEYSHEETRVFEDMAITGRGLFNAYIDNEKDLRGDIVIERFGYADCYFGPHEKDDLSDCEHLTKAKWFSLAKIKQIWPEKADSIQKNFDLMEYGAAPTGRHRRTPGRQYADSENKQSSVSHDPSLVNMEKKEFRILEQWRKDYRVSWILVNAEDDFYFNAENWSKKDVDAVAVLMGFESIPRHYHRMRKTVVGGDVLLEDDFPDLAVQDFPIIAVYAKKRGNKWWGKIESVKDIQREINKRHSQAVDILNKVAAYGWFKDKETFQTPADSKKFEETSSSPGFVVDVSDINRPPRQVEGVKFPAEIVQLETMASLKLKQVMNLPPEIQGFGGRTQSGVALLEQKRQGLIGNDFLFDNLNFSKKRLGRMIVAMVQKYYNAERVMRIIENQARKEPVELGGQPLQSQDRNVLIGLLNRDLFDNADLLKYDVTVGESSQSPTTRRANFLVWLEAAKTGVPVPPNLLVELSDLPDKERVLESMRAMQEAAQQAEQQKTNAEIQKTVIAASARQRENGSLGGATILQGIP